MLPHRVPGGRAVARRARSSRRSPCTTIPSPTTCSCIDARRLAGSGRADARLGAQARACRRGLSHLPGQHHPPGAAVGAAALAAAVAAHRRSSGRAGRGARLPRLGLTGTRYLVDSEVYPEKLTAHGLRVPAPERRRSARRSTASSSRNWCAGSSGPRRSRTFSSVIARHARCRAAMRWCSAAPRSRSS